MSIHSPRLSKGGVQAPRKQVVFAFVASVFVAPIDVGVALSGLVPSLPLGSALGAPGILGGAVHITLITMRARDWTREEYGLVTFGVGDSMLLAFGTYGVAIFLLMASMLTTGNLPRVRRGLYRRADPSLGAAGHGSQYRGVHAEPVLRWSHSLEMVC